MAQLAMLKPSVDHLMDTPLQQLVDELGIDLVVAGITEPGFTGYAYSDNRGVTVALPPGRSELEHDCMARYLIGDALHVDGLPPLPEMFQVHDMTDDVNDAARQYGQQAGDSDPDMDEALRRVREGGVA